MSEIDISLNGLGQSESPVVIDNSSQSSDDCVDFVEYQEPRINCHYTNNSDDETLRLISTNDPCVTGLYVGDNYWATRAEQLGSALAQNSHLLKLHICYENMNMNSFVLDAFFQALALNRSIQHLTLACFDLSIVDIIQILGPFFQSNQNLRCLHISQSRNFILTSFLPLFQCKSTRLERLVLEGNGFQDRQAADLINAMHFESGLRHLSEIRWGSDHIGRFGCIALSKLLRSPATKLRRLNLPSTNLNDADISSLVGALANNSTLIELGLADQKLVTPFGWRSLSYVFSRRNCSLTTINLSRNNVGDDGVIAIGYSLAAVKTRRKGINLDLSACDFVTLTGWQGFASYLSASSLVGLDISGCSVNDDASAVVVTACIRSSSLRSLAMRGMESISAAGWMLCFHALKASDFALDKLEIGFNNIDDRGAEMLFNRLENASLDKLGMGDSTSITPAGWSTCFRSLLQSNTTVETLDLSCNNIDDEGAALLPGLLPRLRTLRLNLIENVLISANGWSLFTDVLRPDSASLLNNLAIGSEIRGEVDDNVVASFAEGLVQNTSLRSLEIFSDAISSRGWSALANALCDNSSIVNMCSSNHTLGTCWVNAGLPHSLLSLLDLNYNEDKADVIRAKILMHFFSDIDNIGQVFAQVPMSTMPNAIEWIGRDRLGLSTMYILLRNFPSIVG